MSPPWWRHKLDRTAVLTGSADKLVPGSRCRIAPAVTGRHDPEPARCHRRRRISARPLHAGQRKVVAWDTGGLRSRESIPVPGRRMDRQWPNVAEILAGHKPVLCTDLCTGLGGWAETGETLKIRDDLRPDFAEASAGGWRLPRTPETAVVRLITQRRPLASGSGTPFPG